MWQDPIVAETRALREQLAAQFEHNADALFDEILRRQEARASNLVTFAARKPVVEQVVVPG
jgi:hypothetical protein